eukprot:4224462-Pyramimonas_sp.AAC.1
MLLTRLRSSASFDDEGMIARSGQLEPRGGYDSRRNMEDSRECDEGDWEGERVKQDECEEERGIRTGISDE